MKDAKAVVFNPLWKRLREAGVALLRAFEVLVGYVQTLQVIMFSIHVEWPPFARHLMHTLGPVFDFEIFGNLAMFSAKLLTAGQNWLESMRMVAIWAYLAVAPWWEELVRRIPALPPLPELMLSELHLTTDYSYVGLVIWLAAVLGTFPFLFWPVIQGRRSRDANALHIRHSPHLTPCGPHVSPPRNNNHTCMLSRCSYHNV